MGQEQVTTLTLGDLVPDPKNARRHNPRNVGMIEQALNEVGAGRSIVIDETGTVLAGNATIEAAAQAGLERVQVVDADGRTLIAVRRSGLTPEQKVRLALYDNRTAELADWDDGVLAELVADCPEVAKGLWSDAELHALLADVGRGQADDEPQLDRAAELQEQWGTELGQMWALGEHRLLCADSTSPDSYRRLFGKERYRLLVTDPPYGVSYADKNAFLNAVGRGNRIQEPIANDHLDPDAMARLWTEAFTCARGMAAPGASYYVTGPQGGELLLLLLHALQDSGFPLRHMLIWAKNNHVLGRTDYHYQHEPILYGWVDGAGHRFHGGHSETRSGQSTSRSSPICIRRPSPPSSTPGPCATAPSEARSWPTSSLAPAPPSWPASSWSGAAAPWSWQGPGVLSDNSVPLCAVCQRERRAGINLKPPGRKPDGDLERKGSQTNWRTNEDAALPPQLRQCDRDTGPVLGARWRCCLRGEQDPIRRHSAGGGKDRQSLQTGGHERQNRQGRCPHQPDRRGRGEHGAARYRVGDPVEDAVPALLPCQPHWRLLVGAQRGTGCLPAQRRDLGPEPGPDQRDLRRRHRHARLRRLGLGVLPGIRRDQPEWHPSGWRGNLNLL